MTKFKTYKCGPYTFKSYCKPVGHGWEIGYTYKGRNYFTSNFVNKTEAVTWWKKFNSEIVSFCKKFYMSNKMPFTWYCNFMANHMYKTYYTWLDQVFAKNGKTFKRAYTKDARKYATLKKRTNFKTTPAFGFKTA